MCQLMQWCLILMMEFNWLILLLHYLTKLSSLIFTCKLLDLDVPLNCVTLHIKVLITYILTGDKFIYRFRYNLLFVTVLYLCVCGLPVCVVLLQQPPLMLCRYTLLPLLVHIKTGSKCEFKLPHCVLVTSRAFDKMYS